MLGSGGYKTIQLNTKFLKERERRIINFIATIKFMNYYANVRKLKNKTKKICCTRVLKWKISKQAADKIELNQN